MLEIHLQSKNAPRFSGVTSRRAKAKSLHEPKRIAVGLRSLGEKMEMIRHQAVAVYRKRVLLSLCATATIASQSTTTESAKTAGACGLPQQPGEYSCVERHAGTTAKLDKYKDIPPLIALTKSAASEGGRYTASARSQVEVNYFPPDACSALRLAFSL